MLPLWPGCPIFPLTNKFVIIVHQNFNCNTVICNYLAAINLTEYYCIKHIIILQSSCNSIYRIEKSNYVVRVIYNSNNIITFLYSIYRITRWLQDNNMFYTIIFRKINCCKIIAYNCITVEILMHNNNKFVS